MVAQLPNPFLNSTAISPCAVESAVASKPPPVADATAAPTDHIHEIFFYVRKLMTGDTGFVLDETLFMAEVEEVPLFVRDGDHLRRWEA